MNRLIKFRAWHKKHNCFINLDCLFFEDYKINGWAKVSWGSIERKSKALANFSAEDVDVMQYTGLKDRNGKDIYESDLVVVAGKTSDPKKVYWDEKVAAFDFGADLIEELEELLVVGNIYETPNLLPKNDFSEI